MPVIPLMSCFDLAVIAAHQIQTRRRLFGVFENFSFDLSDGDRRRTHSYIRVTQIAAAFEIGWSYDSISLVLLRVHVYW